ncbi:MAG: stage 0 sporulation family protein [Chloroflexota bacterium]
MANIVGVRFGKASKTYYFDPSGIDLALDDYVIVETARGQEMGQVAFAPREATDGEVTTPLKPVLRKAAPEDVTRCENLGAKEKEALAECAGLVSKLNLPMKLLGAEYSLDGSHVTIYFSAEQRVDFRELVRELAGRLRMRVELRQLGPRDEAKLLGGCGRCGRPLCCMSFLQQFDPVSIRMAKQQDLPLNPMKISGVCGRLMCCLVYENEQYRQMKENLPRVGQKVTTATGPGKVVGTNPLKATVLVELETEATVELPVGEVTYERRTERTERTERAEPVEKKAGEKPEEESLPPELTDSPS